MSLSWVPFPTPGHLPDGKIKATIPVSPAMAGRFFTTSATCEAHFFFPISKYKYIFYLSMHVVLVPYTYVTGEIKHLLL